MVSRRNTATSVGVALVVGLGACGGGPPPERVLTVGPDPVPCAGGAPGTCIRVMDGEGDVWITRPARIQGFTYEPGYTYRLQVQSIADATPGTEAGRPQLRLTRVISREGSGEPEEAVATRLGQEPWVLRTIEPSGYTPAAWAASGISAEFDVSGERIAGFAGCNEYSAGLSVTGDRIDITAPVSTRKACPPEVMDAEQEYLRRLQGAETFVVADDLLELSLADGGGMAFQAAR